MSFTNAVIRTFDGLFHVVKLDHVISIGKIGRLPNHYKFGYL